MPVPTPRRRGHLEGARFFPLSSLIYILILLFKKKKKKLNKQRRKAGGEVDLDQVPGVMGAVFKSRNERKAEADHLISPPAPERGLLS